MDKREMMGKRVRANRVYIRCDSASGDGKRTVSYARHPTTVVGWLVGFRSLRGQAQQYDPDAGWVWSFNGVSYPAALIAKSPYSKFEAVPADSFVLLDCACNRCGKELNRGADAEACWYCLGPLCHACWDAFGHCGEEQAIRIAREVCYRG